MPAFFQPFQTPHKLDLRHEAAIGAVEYVAGHEERINMTIDTKINHALVGIERGTPKDLRNLRLRLTDALERAIEVKIGRMHKAKCHDASILAFGI